MLFLMCSLDKGKEDNFNLNYSENDQQWQGGWGWGVRVEAWWALRGLSDERNARGGGGKDSMRTAAN